MNANTSKGSINILENVAILEIGEQRTIIHNYITNRQLSIVKN